VILLYADLDMLLYLAVVTADTMGVYCSFFYIFVIVANV